MKFGPKPFLLCLSISAFSLIAAAQGPSCAPDGDAAGQASPIGCVTGEGVQITTATPVATNSDPLPLTPEQRPAAPPLVTYVNGRLAVSANNSTLGDVLRAIANKTGAAIDIPENANERVVSQLGPAPARDVIAALLNGSHFNYVMVGNETDANAVARVVLTAKSDHSDGNVKGGTGTTTASAYGRSMVQPRNALQAAVMQPYQEMLKQQEAQQETAEATQSAIAESISEPTPQTPTPEAPVAAPVAGGSASADASPIEPPPAPDAGKGTNSNEDKTPQQMLQNLYETRRQMMIQQRQPPPQQ